MVINELDYKEIGKMLSDGYYEIFNENNSDWNIEDYENFTECMFYINNILTDGDKFIDGDYDILLESLYEVHDYVIKNNMEYIKEFKYKQNIDEIIQCLEKYIDENF